MAREKDSVIRDVKKYIDVAFLVSETQHCVEKAQPANFLRHAGCNAR